jgi:queuine tRNA-ribosyltransferase
MTGLGFQVLATDGGARMGRLETARGAVETPAFMPVGTAATVKAMTPEAVAETGARMILANTYHLMLRPGAERIAGLGGLHAFMAWPGPILTDSGGYQVMSLAKLRRIEERGVTFRSHLDGAPLELTPETAVAVQAQLGADVAMVLDECTPFPAGREEAARAMRLSLGWAERSKAAYAPAPGRGLFAIVQGGVFDELRQECAEALIATGFDGYAIGGLAVGEGQERMFAVLDATAPLLPVDRPRYLMGVGKPLDLVGAVGRGIDMFDCVLPTRSGRTGQAFTRLGALNLRNARFADDAGPLDAECACPSCAVHSRAYLNHLVRADKVLGAMLLTRHNLHSYQDLMTAMRRAIAEGRFAALAEAVAADQAGDGEDA